MSFAPHAANLSAATAPGPASAKRPWWRGAVIYQIYPRSFRDLNGDGVGDLLGVIAGLDHVASLGVDAIWLSPFFTSPMRDYGYDIADFCDVDPMFGTLDDFDRLVARAHALGLKVIIDQVYSHTSDQHPWFVASRTSRTGARADWYVWADAKPDGSPPNNWRSVFHGPAWTWDARRGQYYLHNFLPEQPDLDLHNPEVQDALIGVAKFWLERGVDGFRADAVNFFMCDPALKDNPPAPDDGRARDRPFDFQLHVHNQSQPEIAGFLERLRGVLDQYDDRFTVAEVGGEHALPEMMAFTKGDGRLNSAYGFTFLYAQALTPAVVRETIAQWRGEPGEGWPSWAFSNHDAPRAASRFARGEAELEPMARLTLLLLLSLRGNAFLYQGEELGLEQGEVAYERLRDPEAIANWPATLGRDGARTPLPWRTDAAYAGFSTVEPWLPVDPRHHARAIDQQETRADSMLHYTRRLLSFRRGRPAMIDGDLRLLETPEPLIAFERLGEGTRLLCVFNLGRSAMAWTPDEPGWRVGVATSRDISGGAPPAVLAPLSGYVAVRD
jgi:alpha-glucosidase